MLVANMAAGISASAERIVAATHDVAMADDAKVLVTVPVELVADEFVKDVVWIVRGHAADLASTAWALRRCNGACREGNPLGPDVESRIALKMAGSATAALTCWELRRSGHKNWASAIRWGTVAIGAMLVVNNSYLAIRH